MGRYYNINKKDAIKYKSSDLVMLNCKNLNIYRPAKKYDYKILSSFQIDKTISPIVVYHQLLESWIVHHIVHIKLLESFRLR
jgi:hypothetical protein